MIKAIEAQGASDLYEHARPNKTNRSKFDLSKIVNMTLEPGMIVPFDVMPVLPGDDIDINCQIAIDTLPLIAPSLTRYKVLTHWYFMKARDCWKGFKTFWTRGRSGNENLTVPTIDPQNIIKNKTIKIKNTDQEVHYGAIGYHSLTAYLTGQPTKRSGDVEGTGTTIIKKEYLPYTPIPNAGQTLRDEVLALQDTGHEDIAGRKLNALPYVMYQSIVKNNYVNENLLQNNKALFPDEGDDDWILPYNATTVNFIGRGETDNTEWNNGNPTDQDDWKFDYKGIYSNEDTRVRLDLLRYAMFDNDYFTSGLPWLQRGNPGTVEADITDITAELIQKGDSPFVSGFEAIGANVPGYHPIKIQNGAVQYSSGDSGNVTSPYLMLKTSSLIGGLGISTEGTGQLQLTVNQLREIIALQVWQERNARVDGSYNKMTFQHWQENPNSEEHKPIYIGGTADYMEFGNIIQQSESTESAPLGTTAGYGGLRGNGNVGHFKSNDYGYLMAIMIIKPNTFYEQGLEHFWKHEKVFDEMIQPEFQGLSPEPIYNDEIFLSNDETTNNGLFCYQERYQYLKQRLNQNKGMFTAAPEKDRLFSAYTQGRWLTELPSFSYQFLVMSPENMRRDMLAYQNYPMFRAQIACNVYATRKLAYTSEPNTFGF